MGVLFTNQKWDKMLDLYLCYVSFQHNLTLVFKVEQLKKLFLYIFQNAFEP